MNIFFLHMIPRICAIMHVDKHVVKMILETCQMLCTAHHITESGYIPPYKMTHKNHPCNIWLRSSTKNYEWLVTLGLELCKEYTYRYSKIHKCQEYIEDMRKNIPPIPNIGFTTPYQAMPGMYKGSDSIEAYRAYYFFEKSYLHSWKKRDIPEWIIETRLLFQLPNP